MIRTTAFIAVSALLLGFFASCSQDADAGLKRTLTLTGSSTVAPLVSELAARFESSHPGLRVDVQSGGSSRGIADARAGHADIGMASRALQPSERDLTAYTIARDGVGLIVNAANDVEDLSADQVRAIFTGEITDWQQVGVSAGPIIVVNKAEGRATLAVFLEHFGLESSAIHAAVIAGENEQAIKTVEGSPGAVGYVSIGTAEVDVKAGVGIKLVSLDGVPATTAKVSAGSYPMARPLNLVTGSKPTELALEFIHFAQDSANNDIVLRESFVPVTAK